MRYAMGVLVGSASAVAFDEAALRRGVGSVRHPLARALLALTFTTGLVDAVSYLGLGRVFTANMTGNIVLLGFGIVGAGGLPVVAPVVSLVSFLVGAGAGGVLVKRTHQRHPALVARALGIEVSLIAVAAVVVAATTVRPENASAYLVIALIASAMGVRNAAVRRFAVPDLTTTVLTMTLTAVAAESPLTGGSGEDSIRRLTAVVVMLAGAVAGALLLKTSLWVPLALAAGLAAATVLLYVPAAIRLGRPPTRTPKPHN
jgi:uncharacterized membrane protein YoaK (UPF0700 family)